MPRSTDPNALRIPPKDHITKVDAAPLCHISLTAFVGSYWVWKKKLGLPDPVKVLVNGSKTLFYDRTAVEQMAEAIHRRGRRMNGNGEWMDNSRRLRQMLQNVTEEQEEANPALRRANQVRAARHLSLSLEEYLAYDNDGLSLPLPLFKAMQTLDAAEARRKTRKRRAFDVCECP